MPHMKMTGLSGYLGTGILKGSHTDVLFFRAHVAVLGHMYTLLLSGLLALIIMHAPSGLRQLHLSP